MRDLGFDFQMALLLGRDLMMIVAGLELGAGLVIAVAAAGSVRCSWERLRSPLALWSWH